MDSNYRILEVEMENMDIENMDIETEDIIASKICYDTVNKLVKWCMVILWAFGVSATSMIFGILYNKSECDYNLPIFLLIGGAVNLISSLVGIFSFELLVNKIKTSMLFKILRGVIFLGSIGTLSWGGVWVYSVHTCTPALYNFTFWGVNVVIAGSSFTLFFYITNKFVQICF